MEVEKKRHDSRATPGKCQIGRDRSMKPFANLFVRVFEFSDYETIINPNVSQRTKANIN